MALDKFDKANLNRLKACVRPNQNKINKLKARLKKMTEDTISQIKELEAQNADFNKIIEELTNKGIENTPQETPEEVDNDSEEYVEPESYYSEYSSEEEIEAESVVNSPFGSGDFVNDDFPN